MQSWNFVRSESDVLDKFAGDNDLNSNPGETSVWTRELTRSHWWSHRYHVLHTNSEDNNFPEEDFFICVREFGDSLLRQQAPAPQIFNCNGARYTVNDVIIVWLSKHCRTVKDLQLWELGRSLRKENYMIYRPFSILTFFSFGRSCWIEWEGNTNVFNLKTMALWMASEFSGEFWVRHRTR